MRYLLLALIALAPVAGAQPADPEARAIDRAIGYLLGEQEKSGAWKGDVGYKWNYDYLSVRSNAPHVGTTALACLALMKHGVSPAPKVKDARSVALRRGLAWLVKAATANPAGMVAHAKSQMYSHGVAVLALAEAESRATEPTRARALLRAVRVSISGQHAGGWAYMPGSVQINLGCSVVQYVSLQAAVRAGVRVPAVTLERARAHVRRCHDGGRFRYYVTRELSRSSFALTAGATAVLRDTKTDAKLVEGGRAYLLKVRDRERYGTYFYYHCHWLANKAWRGDKRHKAWYAKTRDELHAQQDKRTGSWHNKTGPGRNYATAMGLLILAGKPR